MKLDLEADVTKPQGNAGQVEPVTIPPAGKKRRRKGCGCLLVVMGIALVLYILGCFLIPPIFTNAAYAYAGEAIPDVGNLRMQISLYQYEHTRLPGLEMSDRGRVGRTSQLIEGVSRVQTFCGNSPAAWKADFSETVGITNGNYWLTELNVIGYELTGQYVRPPHLQYRVDGCGSNGYLYVVGLFPDGDGFLARTGYAVIEIVDFHAGTKQIGVWHRRCTMRERYLRLRRSPKHVVMVNAEEAKRFFGCESAEQAREMNICWVGDTDALMSGDKKQVEKAMNELELAGWDVGR